MANLTRITDENNELFETILDETTIPQWVEFELLNNEQQKELYRISKANDVLKTLADGVDFVVILNEDIFDQLVDDQKKLVIIEFLAGVSYDSEKDTLSLNKPDFTSYTGVLNKFGHERIISLKESVNSLFDQKKQKEEEEKALRSRGKKNG